MKKKSYLSMIVFSCFIVGTCLGFAVTVESETIQKTILNEGFEGSIFPPSGWTSTGWLDSYYGTAHSGSGWAYSWASGDMLNTSSMKFGNNTELSFWYSAELTSNPMSLEVYIDTVETANLIWSETSFSHTSYEKVTIDLSAYSGIHKIIFLGKTSDMRGQLLDDVVITSYVEDNGNGNGLPSIENIPPVADLSKGEPYKGRTNESIVFDGSLSTDPDGTIVKWWWDFGDETTGTGETITHQYERSGTYTVTLHVLDNNSTDANDTTTVTIVQGNNPPSAPQVKLVKIALPLELNIFQITDAQNFIDFYILSSDNDNDSVYFLIDWGDETIDTTPTTASGVKIRANHTWEEAGLHLVTIIAKDTYNASSEATIVTVFMNINVKHISGALSGYLIDDSKKGNYSDFYYVESHGITSMETDDLGRYLIDYNGDGTWDYRYNDSAGLIVYKSQSDNENQSGDTPTKTPGFEVLVLLSGLLLIIAIRKKIK